VLLVSIVVTMVLSIINWLYKRSKVAKDERNRVSLQELHWIFVFGLLVSKSKPVIVMCILKNNNDNTRSVFFS